MTPAPGTFGSPVSWWWAPPGRPNPLALPSDVAAKWAAAGMPAVVFCTHAEAVAASAEPVKAEPAQFALFGTEAA